MFEPASDFTLSEIKAYRSFAFTEAIGNPQHDPFFSVEDAPAWITSHGYQLFALQAGTGSTTLWDPEDVSTKELKAFRNQILSEKYRNHPFFDLENCGAWVNLSIFQAYMETFTEQVESAHSRAPSRAASSVSMAGSLRASSRASDVPSTRASSPPYEDSVSRPPSAMSIVEVSDFQVETEVEIRTAGPSAIATANHTAPEISVAIATPPANERVDTIEYISHVPPTFDVPRNPTALILDLSGTPELLTNRQGKAIPIDRFIRAENQESWDGSSGHPKGDVNVSGFFSDVAVEIKSSPPSLEPWVSQWALGSSEARAA
ncbi:hypothetical protein R3P38DRAFT_3483325 [Favolaschia claudopus]|uniref:Uncharacterized protein n=1 Tax=Favolaschia claudopus TaxID=2862362 RepID=A0AAW0C9U5_9AGAR